MTDTLEPWVKAEFWSNQRRLENDEVCLADLGAQVFFLMEPGLYPTFLEGSNWNPTNVVPGTHWYPTKLLKKLPVNMLVIE
jgi:hypothetical protein